MAKNEVVYVYGNNTKTRSRPLSVEGKKIVYFSPFSFYARL